MDSPSETHSCPASDCTFSGYLSSLLRHIDDKTTNDHSWPALGFSDKAEFEREFVAPRLQADGEIQGPEPCQLTELYEAFRSLGGILEQVIESESATVPSGDLSHPLVRYQQLIGAVVTGGPDAEIFDGYGSQHTNRVSHTVDDYRFRYGNGDWITTFQTIEVQSLRQQTRNELSSRNIVADPDMYVRPITPNGSLALPESVTSEEQLERAIRILSRFPARPTTSSEQEGSSDGIPAEALYGSIISGSGIEPGGAEPDGPIPGPTQNLIPDWRESPAALTAPQTETEIDRFLSRYGKLTHLYKQITPPDNTVVERHVPAFTLDYYEPIGRTGESSQHSYRILSIKDDEDKFISHFRARLRDFIYRRLLTDQLNFDYITVYPGHEVGSLSSSLIRLARETTVETPIVYAQLLERIQTTDHQRKKGSEERWDICRAPQQTLRVRHQIPGANVLILDDVVTSGSSMSAGAHLLREAGANRVIGLGLGLTRARGETSAATIDEFDQSISDVIRVNI